MKVCTSHRSLRYTSNFLRQCKAFVAHDKPSWPTMLKEAPPAMATEMMAHLLGKSGIVRPEISITTLVNALLQFEDWASVMCE